MADVSLSGVKEPVPEKKQYLYLDMGTTIKLMVDIAPYPPLKPYLTSMSNTMTKMFSKNMLIKEILKVYDVKSERKMKRIRPKTFNIINEIVFKNIFEGVE